MFTLFEDLIDFTNELIDLMKQDWENFKKFIKEYKKYVFWFIVLLITMQFTDLMSLGSSWEKYCKKNNILQNGGNGPSPTVSGTPNSTKQAGEQQTEADNKDKLKKALKQKRKEQIIQQAKKKAFSGENDDSKPKTKKPSMFRQFKASLSPSASPVFGNLDRIFSYTQAMFVIIFSILVILGVLSLPVLIFLVITYTIIKLLVSKFMIL